MTKKSPETLLAILDTLASGTVVYSDAAVACGVRPNTFWHWIRASQLGRDPDLFVEYLGERMAFHHAVEAARQIALHDTRARTEKRSQQYLGEPVFFRYIPEGEPVADEIDLDDLLGPEPVPAEPVAEVIPDEPAAPVIPDEPEPKVIPGNRAAPVAFDEAPRRAPRSPLEADLLRRLAAARAKNQPQPQEKGPGNRKTPAGPPNGF